MRPSSGRPSGAPLDSGRFEFNERHVERSRAPSFSPLILTSKDDELLGAANRSNATNILAVLPRKGGALRSRGLRPTTDSDAPPHTSAHEFGHSVLSESGGKYFSITHKGSTGLDQATHGDSPLYPPSPDEIDLMYYYAEGAPPDFYQRVHASNDDILRLLSAGKAKLT